MVDDATASSASTSTSDLLQTAMASADLGEDSLPSASTSDIAEVEILSSPARNRPGRPRMSQDDKNRSRRALYQANRRLEASESRAKAEAALLKDRLLKSEAECAKLKADQRAVSEGPGDKEINKILLENFRLRKELEITKAALKEAQQKNATDADVQKEAEILFRMDRNLLETELQRIQEELAKQEAQTERFRSLRQFF
jgi:small-conductance mechanosensitive channel